METFPTTWEVRGVTLWFTRYAVMSLVYLSSDLTWWRMKLNRACDWYHPQSQDGKALRSSSGCDLSELIKRRLESVASTGSSASSGFIEDKSYCDSEEEEEGSDWVSSFPSPLLPLNPCLTSTPPSLLSRLRWLFFPPQSDRWLP